MRLDCDHQIAIQIGCAVRKRDLHERYVSSHGFEKYWVIVDLYPGR